MLIFIIYSCHIYIFYPFVFGYIFSVFGNILRIGIPVQYDINLSKNTNTVFHSGRSININIMNDSFLYSMLLIYLTPYLFNDSHYHFTYSRWKIAHCVVDLYLADYINVQHFFIPTCLLLNIDLKYI